ncbi:MAG: sporulation peptidase YabG [Clostridiales bacterium]|jgi:spore coat assembly protein|nr:sporulation peptidase YabG [Clostridiales bacterium]
MKTGDIVARRSYGCDLYFRIKEIGEDQTCLLTGINYRLTVSAQQDDLSPVAVSNIVNLSKLLREELNERIDSILKKRQEERDNIMVDAEIIQKPGKVLHIDADREYVMLCQKNYDRLVMNAASEVVAEQDQPTAIVGLLKKHMPDILIITGHDSLADRGDKENIDKYKSSKYFAESVKAARNYNPSKDSLVIIAGACQSFYERLIENGANIASSPKRILIHALDPVFIAEKIAYAPFDHILSANEILENTITGRNGMGAFQTRGTMREGVRIL